MPGKMQVTYLNSASRENLTGFAGLSSIMRVMLTLSALKTGYEVSPKLTAYEAQQVKRILAAIDLRPQAARPV